MLALRLEASQDHAGSSQAVTLCARHLCPRYRKCEARKLWRDVNQAIFDVLEGVSLKDLAAR